MSERQVLNVSQGIKAEELCQLMSNISEYCYCAGWMMGLEYSLWDIVNNPQNRSYGFSEVSLEDIDNLKKLSSELNGWIIWKDDNFGFTREEIDKWGNYFVAIEDWLKMVERYGFKSEKGKL